MEYSGIKVRFSAGTRDLSLLYSLHIDSGAHTACYPMFTVPFLWGGDVFWQAFRKKLKITVI
jgi:hypothetical protein